MKWQRLKNFHTTRSVILVLCGPRQRPFFVETDQLFFSHHPLSLHILLFPARNRRRLLAGALLGSACSSLTHTCTHTHAGAACSLGHKMWLSSSVLPCRAELQFTHRTLITKRLFCVPWEHGNNSYHQAAHSGNQSVFSVLPTPLFSPFRVFDCHIRGEKTPAHTNADNRSAQVGSLSRLVARTLLSGAYQSVERCTPPPLRLAHCRPLPKTVTRRRRCLAPRGNPASPWHRNKSLFLW